MFAVLYAICVLCLVFILLDNKPSKEDAHFIDRGRELELYVDTLNSLRTSEVKPTTVELCDQLESKCNVRKDKPVLEPEYLEDDFDVITLHSDHNFDVITLHADHSESERKLKEDNDKLKEELRVLCLELERLQADLRLSEELNKADMELMCKEVELQHTAQMNAQLEQLNKELKSASIGRVEAETMVNFLMKENAELRRKREEVEPRLFHKEAVPEKSVARSSGIHVNMLLAPYFQ